MTTFSIGQAPGEILSVVLQHTLNNYFNSPASAENIYFIAAKRLKSRCSSDLLVFLLQGIEWTNIDYFNNAIICDLIENVSQFPPRLKRRTQKFLIQSQCDWLDVWFGDSGSVFYKLEPFSYLLSQNQNGILAMLDEECLRPGTVTDETFLDKLNTICAEHQHFESRQSKNSKFRNDHSLPHNCFRIQHYAGKVL